RHVAFLAARRRPQVTETRIGLFGAGGGVGDLAAHLVAHRRPHPRVVAVAEAGEDLEEEQQVASPRNARALQPTQEVLTRFEAGAAESPRKGEPFEGP